MNDGDEVLFPGAFTKSKVRFVHHYLHLVSIELLPPPKPKAKLQVHRLITVTMRNPLDQQTPRYGKLIQHPANPAQRFRTNLSQFSMNSDAIVIGLLGGRRRTPNMNSFAFSSQTGGNQMRIVADAAALGWILGGNQMPIHLWLT